VSAQAPPRPGDGDARAPPPRGLARRFALVLATGFGAGYVPWAPGTAGTLVAVPLYLALARLAPWLQLLTIGAFVAIAIWAADHAGRYFGNSDDGHIVSDEIAGYLVTLALVPVSTRAAIVGFVLFRLFDIVKPWPASYFDREVKNGFGNVLDDVVAGLYGRICLAVVLRVWG
jgi:phosphatidylglycerophosphatase A